MWSVDDRGEIARYLIFGAVFCLLVMALGYWLQLLPMPAFRTAMDRVVFALRLQLFVLPWLAAALAVATHARLHAPNAAAEPSTLVRDMVEQTSLAFGAHLVLAVMLRGEEMVLVAMIAGLFAVGRALWWFGDRFGARARALGFALSFYPSVAALVMALLLQLVRG